MKYIVLYKMNDSESAFVFNSYDKAVEYINKCSSIADNFTKTISTIDKFHHSMTLKDGRVISIEIKKYADDKVKFFLSAELNGKLIKERQFADRSTAIKAATSILENNGFCPSLGENEVGKWSGKNYETNHEVLITVRVAIKNKKSDDYIDCVDMRHVFCNNEFLKPKPLKNLFNQINRKNALNTRKKKVFAGICIALLWIIGLRLITLDWQMISDEIKASGFNASEEIKKIADDLSLTRKGKAVLYASKPVLMSSEEFNKRCGYDGNSDIYTAGCYYKDKENNDEEHINIYNVGSGIVSENGLVYNLGIYRKTILHHEMLHAAWERESENDQTEICKDLKTVSSEIPALKDILKLYDSSKTCSELFARIGSEYIAILSSDFSSSATVPIKYSDLKKDAKTAAEKLTKVYQKYFDTSKKSTVIAHWNNEKQLSSYMSKLEGIYNTLVNKENRMNNLRNFYYRWPTYATLASANIAITEYNNALYSFKSYYVTYRKIRIKLDSELESIYGKYVNI